MIAGFLLAQILAGPATPTASPTAPLTPATVVQRYSAAITKVREPRVMTFDYTLDQTGPRTLQQTHRIFRNAADERDETLTVDGKKLSPPKVRVFRGRRNRYAVSALAPRPADYDFAFVGSHKNAHHIDYVFRLKPKVTRAFAVTDMTIDGVRFLPSALVFKTRPNAGSGNILFGRIAAWWVPYFATASATVANSIASERLSFYTYRFPPTLPSSTFSVGRRLPAAPRASSKTQSSPNLPLPLRTPPGTPEPRTPVTPPR